MLHERFRNRDEAGRLLGQEVAHQLDDVTNVIVLALPRGGVPVACEVAKALGAPLDVFMVRKLGVPGHEELAMGAIASGGVRVMNEDVLRHIPISSGSIEAVAVREQRELERREREYRGARPPIEIEGRTVVIVDDGLATGSTMRAAVLALRRMQPRRIVVAVPVGAESTCRDLRREADLIICLRSPANFEAVGQWYDDFTQTSDEEVHRLLAKSD